MAEGGRIVVPVALRRAMGIGPGDALVLELDGDELRVRSSKAALERIRAELRNLPKGDMLVSDELIADRRAEALRE
ncbi:AbrB/MazE/SpoVT family DNA-binding domain-containing protein [Glacieibacterium sp.]|uniref:AbrB/MazE/SpoVT family DNA-binding domain-containing protein n=1 Tax=Glacieibacterium sp. TaxID=2860237 RepID=UPI003B00E964